MLNEKVKEVVIAKRAVAVEARVFTTEVACAGGRKMVARV